MRPSRVPHGLLGMLALVAAVEASAAQRYPTDELADVWADAYARAGSDEVRSSAILCLGDSQIKLGIDATELAEPAYNLAVHAGQPAAAEALLRRALGVGARPRAVVVGFDPGVLAYPAETNVRQWPEVLNTPGCIGLAIEARDSGLAAMMLLGGIVPTYKEREEVRRAIGAAMRGERDAVADLLARRRRERAEARGSVVAAANPGFVDGPAPAAGHSVWRPKRENERDLRRLLALAEKQDIAVYWVTPTLSPGERERREHSGLVAAYGRLLQGLQAEFPRLVVLETAGLGLDRSVFRDPIHLDGRGSAVLTASVARAMVAGGPRRVVLAPPAIPR
jgi:hypothetical protein